MLTNKSLSFITNNDKGMQLPKKKIKINATASLSILWLAYMF